MKMKYTLNLKYTLSYPRAPAFLAGWVVAVVLVCLVHIAIDITTICTYGCRTQVGPLARTPLKARFASCGAPRLREGLPTTDRQGCRL